MLSLINNENDFIIDMGDTFMYEKLDYTEEDLYIPQLFYSKLYSRFNGSIHLVYGNHEFDFLGNETLLEKQIETRKNYFPLLSDDNVKGNYYSFMWGNSLFIILDAFSFTSKKSG
ncbi:hypothetical protein [Heterosigma akashiwo virus 01]|uniref:Calcineurin-like phosphoesterase domain-containing protein n=1 Tax=Heterosigma akashiwo virus 01 TaxID=97195 RepID=A0A1C9C574_HAV01|nr:hypothetical protein D1R72_gp107 [Heterosigma akashiwo virus 01]AOM63438.1 hypothetical protein [Heterosigma akashiwo virus 01]